jgi:DNA-binding IclR family transcriptional regulator
MPTGSDSKKGGGIQSLVRASALLQEIAKHRDGIGVAQLSRDLGLHTSTAFNLVKTLTALGYVRQDETTKLYRVGSLIFNLAMTASDEVEMAKFAEPFIDQLAMRTGETSHLAMRSGEEVVVVARAYGNTAFHFAERTGTTRPPHATAIGKALLAAMPPENLDMYLSKLELRALTPRTITDRKKLVEEIEKIRRTQIAYDDGEFHPELRCVAVHVHNFTGRVIGALGMSTAIWRLSLNDLAEKSIVLKETAQALSKALGYSAQSDDKATAAETASRGKAISV